MYRIGSKWLLVSLKEMKEFKNRVINRPCNDEISYHKRITGLKDVVKDQDHELYVQKQKISELEKLLKAKQTSTATVDKTIDHAIVTSYPSREEVSKQIQEEITVAVEIRHLKTQLSNAKLNHINDMKKLKQLKALYDNLLDENTRLKRSLTYETNPDDIRDGLAEAKLIIDALQRENALLKSQISDYEAHKCHCDNITNEEYTMLKEKYDKILRDNVLLMAEEGKREQDKKDNEDRYNIYRDRMNRVVNESLAKARYFAGLTDYLDDAMDLLSKIGVHTVSHTNVSTDKTTNRYFITLYGTKYQTSMKLHQVTSQFVEKAKSLEKEVSAYRNADLEETMNEDEE